MKKKSAPGDKREPSPVPNTLDRRGRERSHGEEQVFENAPKAPDGVSGDWE